MYTAFVCLCMCVTFACLYVYVTLVCLCECMLHFYVYVALVCLCICRLHLCMLQLCVYVYVQGNMSIILVYLFVYMLVYHLQKRPDATKY